MQLNNARYRAERSRLQKIALVLAWSIVPLSSFAQSVPGKLCLWFNRPAADWNEALPVGNGSLGAMVFGGVSSERLQLNESSVWTGKPADFVNPEARKALPEVRKLLFEGRYAEAQRLAQEKMMGDKKVPSSYQTLGDLSMEFSLPGGEVTEYRRELDLETAISSVSFTAGGVQFKREVFSSFPAKALVVRLTASKAGALSFALQLSRPGGKAAVQVQDDKFLMTEHVGNGTGVRLAARINVLHEGGTAQSTGQALKVEKANSVTLLLTAATDYRGGNPETASASSMKLAVSRKFEELKREHIADYQAYFKRVSIDLGSSDAVYFPTDSRIAAMQAGNTDPALIALYYQFGRYLLISSSRPGGLPANLQGIWADGLTPPWDADYHININIQMNYWLSETTNLSELHMPFLQFLNELLPDARKTARDMYGLKGAVAHFTTDAWHFTEPYGQTQWAMWPMGLAWSAQHLWEHYAFTGDKEYLKDLGYPVMKEAAEFCEGWLVEDPQSKKLVSGPSISPENTFRTKGGDEATMVMGPTMDHMIIGDLLRNTIIASKVLGTDAALRRRLEKILSRLAPTRIGSDGRIMEWTEEFEEPSPGHRHISHLFALHPGNEITSQQPELLAAARKTIDYRLSHGGGHTGWSRAWIVNFFARLQDGQAAYENLNALLRKSTLPNLFDTHPPFQIDGNFGAVSGITEMLMQSHTGEIVLLPALPAAWSRGSVRGIVARGGFEVDIAWQEGKLKQVKVRSRLGNPCTLRWGDKKISIPTEKNGEYLFDGDLQKL